MTLSCTVERQVCVNKPRSTTVRKAQGKADSVRSESSSFPFRPRNCFPKEDAPCLQVSAAAKSSPVLDWTSSGRESQKKFPTEVEVELSSGTKPREPFLRTQDQNDWDKAKQTPLQGFLYASESLFIHTYASRSLRIFSFSLFYFSFFFFIF